MQFGFLAFLLGQFPRFAFVDHDVGRISQRHDFAQGAAELALLVSLRDVRRGVAQGFEPRSVGASQLAGEFLADETRAAAGDIDVLANEIGIDAGDEVVEPQVDIFHRAVQLGGVVVAQPFRVKSLGEIAFGGDEGAARLAHLGPVDGQKTVSKDAGRGAEPGKFQFGRPEQRVEVENVLADEVVKLGVGVRLPPGVKIHPALCAQVFERAHVAHRRIHPDVEILAWRIRNFEAEIRRIARNIPVGELVFFVIAQPFLHLVGGFRLQATGVTRPAAQKVLTARVGELEKIMVGMAQFGDSPGNGRTGVLQFVRRIGRAACFAVVTVLIFRAAFRAAALDETVRQEDLPLRVEVLLDTAFFDQSGRLQAGINFVGVVLRFRRMGAVKIVKGNVETGKIAHVFVMYAPDQCFGRDAFLFGTQHDRRTVRVVGANVPAFGHPVFRLHLLEAHPDVGLDVFNEMAEVNGPVGVGQGRRNENFTGHGDVRFWNAGWGNCLRRATYSSKVRAFRLLSR